MSDAASIASPLPRTLLQRAQFSFNQREREVRDTIWLLVALVWVILPHLLNLSLWYDAGIVALLGWRAWLTWYGHRLPPRWALMLLMLISGGAVALQFGTLFGKDAGVAFLILLLGLKVMEMRARRDIFVVIFLSLFVMLTSLFDSQSIGAALMIMIGVVLLITVLVSTHFVGREPSYAVKLRIGAQICLMAVPLMLVLFVLFPRIQGPLWGMPTAGGEHRTGLSNQMSPGDFDDLSESNDIAFRVKFNGRIPQPAERYWRGPVFGSYDGFTWRPLLQGYQSAEPTNLHFEFDQASLLDYTVTMEPHHQSWLFLLELPAKPPAEIEGATMRPDLQIVAPMPIHQRTRYSARSYTQYRVATNLTEPDLAVWLHLPRYNPRTRALAAQLRAQESDDHKLIRNVLRMFHDQNFIYTLKPPKLQHNGNAVDQFLFDTRRGFCEHFAGSFVTLMRAANIPARVVTGYQGGQINPVDGYMEVRQLDAHAWAEVWLPNEGWVRVDPTAAVAPERIERGPEGVAAQATGVTGALLNGSSSLMASVRFNLEAVANAWNQWVLAYDSDNQRGLFSSLGMPDVDWHTLTIALIVAFGVVLAFMGAQIIARRERPDPVVALYFRLCNRLARMAGGRERLPNEAPATYLARILPALPPETRSAASAAINFYQNLRYAPAAQPQPELLRQFKACIAALRN